MNKKRKTQFLKILIGIGIMLFLLVSGYFIVKGSQQSPVSNLIQGEALIILALITLYYAMQTRKLVKQEEKSLAELKRKRIADFWEKRHEQFYNKFMEELNNMREAIYKEPIDKERINEICRNTKDLMWKTEHMISEDTYKRITKLRAYLNQIPGDKKGGKKEKFINLELEVRELINEEWKDVKKTLRDIYAIEKREE